MYEVYAAAAAKASVDKFKLTVYQANRDRITGMTRGDWDKYHWAHDKRSHGKYEALGCLAPGEILS